MEKLIFTETQSTPAITFDPANGILEMKGRSIPEDSITFYEPLMEAMDKYVASPKSETTVTIQLEYFSTSSSKIILDLFKQLETIHKKGNAVVINWLYEDKDEDMREAGVDYESIVEVPFKIISIEETD